MPRKTASHHPRCHYRMECGRRCRKPVSAPESRFCGVHEALTDARLDPEDSAALTAGLDEFSSAADIGEFLARLLRLLAENRISPRRASVLAYITNQILRTIALRTGGASKPQPPQFIWDIPRPPYDPAPPQTATQAAPAAIPATTRSSS